MSSENSQLTVGDIVSLQRGNTYKSAMLGLPGPVLLGLGTIQRDGGFRGDSLKTYGGESAEKLLMRPGDLYVSLKDVTQSGDLLGAVARVPGTVTLGRLTQDTVKLVVENAEYPLALLYWTLRSPEYRAYCRERGTGTTNLALSREDFLSFALPAPTPTRIGLVGLLELLEDRITLLRETNATLEAIAQAVFKSWFVDFDPVRAKQEGRTPDGMDEATATLFPDAFDESELGLVPRGWQVMRLGDVTERITKGTTPTTIKRPFVPTGINFVKAESMTDDGQFIPEKFSFIDNETHEFLGRSQLKAGDVLITIAGTIGRMAVMTEDFLPANTNQAVALIRPLQGRFPSGMVSRFLKRSDSQRLMGERVVQAVQANLSLRTLSDLKVVIPPPEVTQRLYGLGLAQIDDCRTVNVQRIRTLANLRDTLLPRLISGQLRLPAVETETLAA